MTELDRLVGSLDPSALHEERWFGGKGRPVSGIELVDGVIVDRGALAIVDVRYEDAGAERYTLLDGARLWSGLLAKLRVAAAGGELGGAFAFSGELPGELPSLERPIGIDQSNTSVRLGESLLVKCYRRLWPGLHPEVELVAYLGERVDCVPRALGTVRYADPSGDEYTVALVQELVADAVDGWAWGRELHESLAAGVSPEPWGAPLGGTIASLHVALAGGPEAREATGSDRRAWQRRGERELARALDVTRGESAEKLARFAPRIARELAAFSQQEPGVVSRIHGDLHVGQVLRSPAGLFVIDFEGEPTRPPDERRALDSPLRDVASLLRSFEHLPRWVFRDRPGDLSPALAWAATQRDRFLEAYGHGVLGSAVRVDGRLLRALEVEKATYELVYAATFLPEWTPIAVGAMDALLEQSEGAGPTRPPH